MIVKITDHVTQALGRLLQQYKGKPNLAGVISILVTQLQELENTGFDLIDFRGLETATGLQLDLLGTIVGQAREGGQSDDDYRIRLKTRIFQNLSEGEPETIIAIYKMLTGATKVFLVEGTLASFSVYSEIPFTSQAHVDKIFEQIKLISPVAVSIDGLGVFDVANAFSFSGGDGAGFSSIYAPTTGGKFATKVRKSTHFGFNGDDSKVLGFGTIHDPLAGGAF